MITDKRLLALPLLPLLPLLLSGCQTGSEIGAFDDPGFGEANRQTMAAQVVNPDPVYTDANPPTSADNAVDAIDRLRSDRVKKPERIDTRETGPG